MATSWYYAKNNQQLGPVPIDTIRQMLSSGQLLGSDLVWANGMPEWVPASSVPEFFTAQGPQQVTAVPLGYRGAAPATGKPPKNYLVESIFCTLCCCLPFGIVGIVYASQVNSKYARGDVAGAQESADNAKKWITRGMIIGLVVGGIRGVMQFMAQSHR